MQVLVTIPKNIINKCLQNGWEEQEIKVLFSEYLSQVTQDDYNQFEFNFETWLEDLDEEELGDTFRNAQQLEVGMEVEVVDGSSCNNFEGDTGFITEYDESDDTFRVTVEGRSNKGNWMKRSQIARINY